jgi:hypothetical protein
MFDRHHALGAMLILLGSSAYAGVQSVAGEANVTVSLAVEQSCLIHSATRDHPETAPQVECLHDELYAVSRTLSEPTHTSLPHSSSLTQGATAGQPDIWMVGF